MILEKGDMWNILDETNVFCITTNSYFNFKEHKNFKEYKLIMEAGIAKEAKLRFPDLPRIACNKLIIHGTQHLQFYGTRYISIEDYNILLFQTKYHFKDKSEIGLIKKSLHSLFHWMLEYPEFRFDLNFPGIGYDGLKRETVLPHLELFPDNLHIWELK